MPYTRNQRRSLANAGRMQWKYFAGRLMSKFSNPKTKESFLDRVKGFTAEDSSPKKEMVQENLPSGVSKALMKLHVNPPLRGMVKGSVEYRDYYNYELAWQAGTKSFWNICNLGTKTQWTSQLNVPNMANDVSQNLMSLSPQQGQVAGSIVSANSDPLAQKVGVSSADVKIDFINLSTLPFRLKVSWYRVKEGTSNSILGKYNLQVPNQALFTSNFMVNTAIVTEPTSSGNETVLSYSGATATAPENLVLMPYINLSSRRDVFQYYTHLKSHSVVLAPGDIHSMNNLIDLNIYQRKEIINESDADQYANGSIQCVIECQGLATHLVVPSSPGPPLQPAVNEITCAAGRIGVMISRHLNLKCMKVNAERWDATYIGKSHNVVFGNIDQSATIQSDLAVAAGEVVT